MEAVQFKSDRYSGLAAPGTLHARAFHETLDRAAHCRDASIFTEMDSMAAQGGIFVTVLLHHG